MKAKLVVATPRARHRRRKIGAKIDESSSPFVYISA